MASYCAYCGKVRSKRNQKYCSQNCYHKNRRGKAFSLEHRERIKKALLGRKRPEEVKRKISETRKKRIRLNLIVPWNKGKKGLQKAWNKGLDKTDPRLRKLLKHKTWLIAQQRLRELMKDSQWKSLWLEHCMASQEVRPNKLEMQIILLIQKHSLPLRYVGDGKVVIGGKCPDFIGTAEKRKVVEVFGDYWHRIRKGIPWHQTEYGTKKIYSQYGFECLILWEAEIKQNAEDETLEKLEGFLYAS